MAAGLALTSCADTPDEPQDNGEVSDGETWRMPDEGEPHLRTWMAFGASDEIWGRRLNRKVQQNLGAIAQAIAQFEPVSMLVRPQEIELARQLAGPNVELVPAPLDDLWIRDSGPVFVRNDTGKAAVDFNFNGWGSSAPASPSSPRRTTASRWGLHASRSRRSRWSRRWCCSARQSSRDPGLLSRHRASSA